MKLPAGWADLPDDWRKRCDPHDQSHAAFWHSWHHERAEAVGLIYDEHAADARVAFFGQLRLVKGKWGGQPFTLLPHAEHQIVRPFFGYKEPGTTAPAQRADLDPLGRRYFRRVDHWVGKKNAKSTLGGGLGAEAAFMEREPGVEVYLCAADREQASIVYQTLAPMVREQPTLNALSKRIDSQKRIVIPSLNGFINVNSSEAYTKHGTQQFAVLADEVHAWPGFDYWDVMTQGAFASRDEWILYVMSTPGFNLYGVGYREYNYAQSIRKGEEDCARLLPAIHTNEASADWHDPATWYAANPALGYPGCGYPYALELSDLQDEYNRAVTLPSTETAFRVLRLATWMPVANNYFNMGDWVAGHAAEPRDFTGPVWAGMDLSETQDLTAYMLFGWDDDGGLSVRGHYFLPGHNIGDRERRDKVPYREWAAAGWITLTEGDVIDYSAVRAHIHKMTDAYGMPQELAYDRYNARQIAEVWLAGEDGYTVTPVPQGPPSLSEATKRLKDIVTQKKLRTGGDPVLKWMAENTAVKTDTNGNVAPNKAPGGKRRKIDGIAALVTGMSRSLINVAEPASVYETRGLLTL